MVVVSVLFNEPKLLKLMQYVIATLYVLLVSVLFNEPKLLKSGSRRPAARARIGFSALQRAEIAEIAASTTDCGIIVVVSVLFNEPKLLKSKSARS